MNQLGVVIFWCILQVTVVAVVTLLVASLLRRRLIGGVVASSGLVIVVMLTVCAFSRWPAWNWYSARLASVEKPANPLRPRIVSPNAAGDSDRVDAGESQSLHADQRTGTAWGELVQAAADGLESTPAARGWFGATWHWGEIVVVIVGGFCVVGFFRVLTGIIAVRRVVNRASPISDDGLSELVDVIRAELSCRATIRLLESSELATAATTGWLHPAVLLPVEWRSWTELERRAVLAHEIAHVRSRDFLACLAAQCSLAMHFYHPVVHWLVHGLRMDLELAADASASSIVGPGKYLHTLANMALRQEDRRLGWPARTFLPTRGTFLRRIEMLRDNGTLPRKPWSSLRLAGLGVVALAGLAAAGLRGAADRTTALTSLGSAEGGAAIIEWLPADTAALLVIKPKQLLVRPELADLLKTFRPPTLATIELHTGNVEQVTLALIPEKSPGGPAVAVAGEPPSRSAEPREFTVVRFTVPTKQSAPLTAHTPVGESEFLGYRLHFEGPTCWFQANDRTIVVSSNELIKVAIASGAQTRLKLVSSDAWRSIAENPLALAINTEAAKPWFEHAASGASWLEPYAPIWLNTTAIFVGASLNNQLQISGVVQCRTASDVEPVADTLAAAVTLAKNTASRYRERLAEVPEDNRAMVAGFVDLADKLLVSVRAEKASNNQLKIAAATGLAPESVRLLTNALTQASAASAQQVAMNNLKQLLLAMHNYHSVHGRFPPAIVQGRDGTGGPPHSWRIELLPYIEAADVYNAYRFDEPWDSASNKLLLARMPAVFRSPGDAPGSTNAGYFGLVGPGTLFSNPKGVAITEILDGTSNTIALVQATRDIPWTKPEDIIYSPDKPLPEMGASPKDGIQIGLCDGSVRVVGRDVDQNMIRAMITIAGGEVIQLR